MEKDTKETLTNSNMHREERQSQGLIVARVESQVGNTATEAAEVSIPENIILGEE